MRRRLATAGLLALLMGSLLVEVPGLHHVIDRIESMKPGWLALAVALEIASSLGFVVVFRMFFDHLPARAARRLAWTEMASGALLPGGGAGGLAIGGWLLHMHGMPIREIVRRSSGLFFLTSGVNVAVVAGSGVLLATGAAGGPHDVVRTWLPVALAAGATAAVLALPRLVREKRSDHWLGHVAAGIVDARGALARPSWRLAGAVAWLGFDIAVLWATFMAVGHAPPVAALVVAYMLGYLANALPVPGGIGVLDGGLAVTLVAYGSSPATAAAAVLVYHAIALWVPGIGGSIAYALLRRGLVTEEQPQSAAPARLMPGRFGVERRERASRNSAIDRVVDASRSLRRSTATGVSTSSPAISSNQDAPAPARALTASVRSLPANRRPTPSATAYPGGTASVRTASR